MCPTRLQLEGTVVNASAIISLPANTSHSLNSTLNLSSTKLTLPVINACALIRFQSSKRGFKLAISGACKKASLLRGLKRPEVFKLFSTILEISDPKSFIFKILLKFFLELASIDNGDTAIGRGFKFPLVISTSINANVLVVKKI